MSKQEHPAVVSNNAVVHFEPSKPKGAKWDIEMGMNVYASEKTGEVQVRKRAGRGCIFIGTIRKVNVCQVEVCLNGNN